VVGLPNPATCAKAASNCPGRVLPRRPARRRIPLQAFALKKYRSGTPPVSKISDNEDTPASLRDSPSKPVHSDILSVKHSPCEAIGAIDPRDNARSSPAAGGDLDSSSGEESQNRRKCSSSVVRKDAADVLPDHPRGPISPSNRSIDERQVATRIIQSSAEPGDGVGLARRSAGENIDVCIIGPLLESGRVAEVRDARVSVGEDGGREVWPAFVFVFGVVLREGDRGPAQRAPCLRLRRDPGADAEVPH
jgi:hypothetical protein